MTGWHWKRSGGEEWGDEEWGEEWDEWWGEEWEVLVINTEQQNQSVMQLTGSRCPHSLMAHHPLEGDKSVTE